MFDAQQGKDIGFIDKVYSHNELQQNVFEFAMKIAKQPLIGIQAYMKIAKMVDSNLPLEKYVLRKKLICVQICGDQKPIMALYKSFYRKNKVYENPFVRINCMWFGNAVLLEKSFYEFY